MRAIIALLTDFGVRDHYVAAMKGVVLTIAPEATLVDITHEVAPQDVVSAALELAACWRDFPPGSIFVVVVDPGVGTPRRAIAAAAADRTFVAPDNGVLSLVLEQSPPTAVVEISNPGFLRAEISRTFEGRDRFAPAAAWLARGTPIAQLGPDVENLVTLDVARPRVLPAALVGEVLKVDRFGNAITNISRMLLERAVNPNPEIVVEAGGQVVPLVATYGEAVAGGACALVGSGGHVEIAVNGGSAARVLGLDRGARVVVAADRAALTRARASVNG